MGGGGERVGPNNNKFQMYNFFWRYIFQKEIENKYYYRLTSFSPDAAGL
jgi:hypothetical protein